MRFYNGQHQHWCGIDLHARTMYVCILDAQGQVRVDKNRKATPEAFLEAVAPYREGLSSKRPPCPRAPRTARRPTVVGPVARQPAALDWTRAPAPSPTCPSAWCARRSRVCASPEPGDNGPFEVARHEEAGTRAPMSFWDVEAMPSRSVAQRGGRDPR